MTAGTNGRGPGDESIAVRARGLSKRYALGPRVPYRTLRDALASAVRGPFRREAGKDGTGIGRDERFVWALRDVSFDIRHGEVVGVIGRNGAGKSTLLKILSRITEPTEGYAEIRGRIGSLLEVGTGFHPELSGRENIYLNGAILGMAKGEIDRKFDEIVAFAEVERFLDTPVKHYSSGMYLRLAFSVAAHLEPDILLVDEVLAVGDAAFRKKCLGKMGDVARQGRTVLFVSHDMAAIEGLCRNAFLLEEGRIVRTGPAGEVVQGYLANLPASAGPLLESRPDRRGNGRLRFTDIAFRGSGTTTESLQSGQDVEVMIGYRGDGNPLRNVSVSVPVFTLGGQCMMMLANQLVGADLVTVPREGKFTVRIPRFPLSPGRYYLNLFCEVNGILADWVTQAVFLTVEGGDFYGTGRLPPASHGGLLLSHEWSVEERAARETAGSDGKP